MKHTKKLNKIALALATYIMMIAPAKADVMTTTFNVSANILSPCSVFATDMDFGDVTLSVGAKATSSITVACSSPVSGYVHIGGGLNFTSDRNVHQVIGSNTYLVSYKLFIDLGETEEFLNSTTIGVGGVALSGTMFEETIPVYGSIPVQGSQPGGLYTDTVQVVVNY